jgi:hypothetical protein
LRSARLVLSALLLLWAFVPARPAFAAASPLRCDRACLGELLDTYLTALVQHRPGSVPVAAGFRATENGAPIRLGEGSWKSATGLGSYRIRAVDPATGGAVFVGVLNEGAKATMFALRLKVARRRIAEAETIVARIGMQGDAANAPSRLTTARAGFAEPLAPGERSPISQRWGADSSSTRACGALTVCPESALRSLTKAREWSPSFRSTTCTTVRPARR